MDFTLPIATLQRCGFGFLLLGKRREKDGTMMRKEGNGIKWISSLSSNKKYYFVQGVCLDCTEN